MAPLMAFWMSETRCSVIIPVLNEASQLATRLAFLRQWSLGHELIVVDGGSRDASVEIARQYADRVLLSCPGRARQMNAGARVACGDYLLFLHCDTAPEFAMADFLDGLSRQPGWGFCRVALSGQSGVLALVALMMNLRSSLTQIATGDQMLFLQRELFEEIGGYAEIPLMEDVEICKRLRRNSRSQRTALRVVTSSRRWREQGTFKTILRMWQLRLRYWLGASPAELHRRYYGVKAELPLLLMQFAREPIPGRVKTRLQPYLSAAQATNLHSEMVLHTTRTLCRSAVGPVQLWVDGDTRAALFQQCLQLGAEVVRAQCQGDLGRRMAQAFDLGLRHSAAVILVGSDAPGIDKAYVSEAASLLERAELVLGPAHDGGYVLIALRSCQPQLFRDVDWGSDEVLKQTLVRAQSLNLEVALMSVIPDIDRPDDLRLLPESLRSAISA